MSKNTWKPFSHTSALGNTGDYMSEVGIENGEMTMFCSNDEIEISELQEICDKLNKSQWDESKTRQEKYQVGSPDYDIVGAFLTPIASEIYKTKPCQIQTKQCVNSNDQVTYLISDNKLIAAVIERRTEFNDLEYTFINLHLVGDVEEIKKVKCSRCENVFDMPVNFIGTIYCESCEGDEVEKEQLLKDIESGIRQACSIKGWNANKEMIYQKAMSALRKLKSPNIDMSSWEAAWEYGGEIPQNKSVEKEQSEIEQIINKYKKYILNIEWDTKTNDRKGRDKELNDEHIIYCEEFLEDLIMVQNQVKSLKQKIARDVMYIDSILTTNRILGESINQVNFERLQLKERIAELESQNKKAIEFCDENRKRIIDHKDFPSYFLSGKSETFEEMKQYLLSLNINK